VVLLGLFGVGIIRFSWGWYNTGFPLWGWYNTEFLCVFWGAVGFSCGFIVVFVDSGVF